MSYSKERLYWQSKIALGFGSRLAMREHHRVWQDRTTRCGRRMVRGCVSSPQLGRQASHRIISPVVGMRGWSSCSSFTLENGWGREKPRNSGARGMLETKSLEERAFEIYGSWVSYNLHRRLRSFLMLAASLDNCANKTSGDKKHMKTVPGLDSVRCLSQHWVRLIQKKNKPCHSRVDTRCQNHRLASQTKKGRKWWAKLAGKSL